jgi:hypothetical protein
MSTSEISAVEHTTSNRLAAEPVPTDNASPQRSIEVARQKARKWADEAPPQER